MGLQPCSTSSEGKRPSAPPLHAICRVGWLAPPEVAPLDGKRLVGEAGDGATVQYDYNRSSAVWLQFWPNVNREKTNFQTSSQVLRPALIYCGALPLS